MIVQLTEQQSDLIKKIAQENGCFDFEVDTCPGTVKGDNYLGIITKVTVKNEGKKMELILKAAATSEALRKITPIHIIYNREIFMYETVFSEFRRFQEEHNISDPFLGYAKLLGKCSDEGSECLVMENMLERGYKLWDRKKPMDSEHISAVFREYAKFHAVSLAMSHKKPELFKNLTKDIKKHVFETDMNNMERLKMFIKSIVDNGKKAVEDEPELLKVLEEFGVSMEAYFMNELKDPKFDIVINHGDSWCNNLMFKYKELENSTKPSEVCILDWQISKRGSPAADLCYFFLAHSPKKVLYDYKNYLKLYHDIVTRNLREFSCDPEEIFPCSLLEQHWNIYIKFGLYMSLMIIKIMYCDTDEAPDFAEISDSGKDFMDSFGFESRNAGGYNQRIKDLLKFLIDNQFI
ncbi:hypothetical protein JTB14_002159 [Gonioctena quinquepunctata]|nr:hypothetical protein JTB14_002159 [Gonioctena quinquepunctata]